MHFFPKKCKINKKHLSYESLHHKKGPPQGSFSSATRTRTGVYGVRGRCPRPLDDSTLSIFLKAGAKVLLFFDMTKFFTKKMHFDMHFFEYWS